MRGLEHRKTATLQEAEAVVLFCLCYTAAERDFAFAAVFVEGGLDCHDVVFAIAFGMEGVVDGNSHIGFDIRLQPCGDTALIAFVAACCVFLLGKCLCLVEVFGECRDGDLLAARGAVVNFFVFSAIVEFDDYLDFDVLVFGS